MRIKNTKIFVTGSIFLSAVTAIISCGKHADQLIPERTNLSTAATVQVFNAIVNSSRNYLYIDGKAVTGAAFAAGGVFPSAASSFAVEYGTRTMLLRDTLPATTQVPLVFTANLAARTNYTIFAYDTITAPKYKIVENKIEYPQDSTARVRFANFMRVHPLIPAVDFYSVKRQANVASNVTITGVTPFIPYASALSDTIMVRIAGTTNLLAQLNGLNPTQKRSYTVLLRGGNTRAVTVAPTY